MEETRVMTSAERRALARLLEQEAQAHDVMGEILDRRDAMLRALRWGDGQRPGVAPETLRAATRSRRYPHAISRTTFYRAVGRTKDQQAAHTTTTNGSDQDGATQ